MVKNVKASNKYWLTRAKITYIYLPQMDVHSETRMGWCVLEGECIRYINIHTNNVFRVFNSCIDLLWKIHSEICKQTMECGRAKQVLKFWNCFKNRKEKKRKHGECEKLLFVLCYELVISVCLFFEIRFHLNSHPPASGL